METVCRAKQCVLGAGRFSSAFVATCGAPEREAAPAWEGGGTKLCLFLLTFGFYESTLLGLSDDE